MAWWHQHHTNCNTNHSPYSILHDFGSFKNKYMLVAGQWWWQQSTAIVVVAVAAMALAKTAAVASGHRRCPSRHGRQGWQWAPPPMPSPSGHHCHPLRHGNNGGRQPLPHPLAGVLRGRGWCWQRTGGGGSATRWDATTRRCKWRRGSRMGTWGGGATRCDVTTMFNLGQQCRVQIPSALHFQMAKIRGGQGVSSGYAMGRGGGEKAKARH